MDEIKISLNEVSRLTNELRRININLDDILDYISNEMKSLSAIWMSDGSEMIRTRFEYFAKRFLEESQTVENYAKFLDHTVNSYDSLETTITQNASNFN